MAVDVPDALKEAVERQVVDKLRDRLPGARWTRPDGRHLTLRFLGEVADGRVPDISRALRAAASSQRPFAAAFDRVGGFPSLRRPRVLWVGIGPGATEMAALAASVEGELAGLGYDPEDRPFTAHLTLARFREPRPLGELPAVEVPTDPFRVGEVVLFRSELHPKGARYTALERLPLV
ncbi:MAG TPA: RNA 2',3'-cyclic phosphodiesterase [Actinomycetota bacterium]|nr:RNA 2',3'-cyclic phosphodiesterase [Actinomycetota bacterium]